MAVTIEKLYDQEKTKNIMLIAGREGLKKVARNIRVIEYLDTAAFLEEQEIAFTTGAGLKDPEDLMELVEKSYNQNASGIVVNTETFISEIPGNVVEFCNSNNLPLFNVSGHVYMTNIIQGFSKCIGDWEKKSMILKNAVKNAINFPEQEKLYMIDLDDYGYMRNYKYCISLIEVWDEKTGSVAKEELQKVSREVENFVSGSYNNIIVLEMDNYTAVCMADYSEGKINEIMESVHEHLVEVKKDGFIVHTSIGGNSDNIINISKSYNKAKNGIVLQKKRKREDEISSYNEMGTYKLLMAVDDKDILKDYYGEFLEQIEIYDRINDTDFMFVLKTFFENKCSVQNTAEVLFMHRNSVRYKLNKIEEILGIDLSGVEDRSRVYLSLMIKEMIS